MNLNLITKAGILLNAARVPYENFKNLCEHFDITDIFDANSKIFEELAIKASRIEKIKDFLLKNSWLEREIDNIFKADAKFITALDNDYPQKLFDLKNPPVGLYIKGKINLEMPSAAIVGTRKSSLYGQNIASGISKALSTVGLNIISGGAKGIDAAAHRACLDAGGITVAVFGTGINKIYPSEHKDLFNRICESGAVISEYPTQTGGEAWRFPERNRIIAALSGRIVIIESSLTGGAMHTAQIAMDLNREIWSVPGKITDDNSSGTNKLIKDGAKILCNIDDFVKGLAELRGQINLNFDNLENASEQNNMPELSDDEKIIYNSLQKNSNVTLDSLLKNTGLNLAVVQSSLLTLSAFGLVNNSGAGRYSAVA